jgi:hypothetical protein
MLLDYAINRELGRRHKTTMLIISGRRQWSRSLPCRVRKRLCASCLELIHDLANRRANKSRKAASIALVLSFTNFGTGQSSEHG